ncbi:MAG: L-serine ammonia-lyase, iron-sulfur-dependent subunit beta [Lachnospiraceae bacterium]|nr:L-serine ammonia-lyase, iron-sulfur-dependent subunit beta [Lachnospiraceae bacterium]
MSLFDILGPVMVGPSSSHTAGAVRIGYIARKLLGCKPVSADIGLHGSFAATGKGHGTDRALVAGLLGMKPDDMRIPDSFRVAKEEELAFSFEQVQIPGAHPNTVLLFLRGEDGKELEVQASSIGGGRIMINKIDGIDVNCTGELPTLIIHNLDQPGIVAKVANQLSEKNINVAAMQIFRDKRGGFAVMVIETDQPIYKKNLAYLESIEGVVKVTYFKGETE